MFISFLVIALVLWLCTFSSITLFRYQVSDDCRFYLVCASLVCFGLVFVGFMIDFNFHI